MSSGRVCFDPDLISTDPNYARDIDSLTTGSLAEPSDPCVPADDVPASFIASGIDPRDPDEVREYLLHRPYYQTAACLWEHSKFADNADPKNVKPVPVDRALWQRNPAVALRTLKSLPNSGDAARTLAYIMTEYPQNDASLKSIAEYFEINNYIAPFQPCSDPVLLGAYDLSLNANQGEGFAAGLARQFRKSPHYNYHDTIGPVPEPSPIQRELLGQTLPVLRSLFETTDDWQRRTLSAKAIAAVGGPAELEYLAKFVIESFDEDKTDGQGYFALDAILETVEWRKEAIPYLEKILAGEYDVSCPFTEERRKQIYSRILACLDGTPYTPALAEGMYNAVVAIRGEFPYERMYDDVLAWFMKNDEDKGIEYLARFTARGDMSERFSNDCLIPNAINHIDDPRIKKALKATLKGEFESKPDDQHDEWEYRFRLADRLFANENPEAHEILLAAMDETKDSAKSVCGNVVQLSEHIYQGGARFAGEYFKRFMDAYRSNRYDQSRRDKAADFATALVTKYPRAIVKEFAGLDPVVKDWLIDRWALHAGEYEPGDPLTQNYLPADIKKLAHAKRESVLGPAASRPTQEHAIRDLEFVSVHLRSQLIDRLAGDESNLDFLIRLATTEDVLQPIRFRIVAAMRATPGTRVDGFLLHATQNLDVGEYAAEALKARTQNPKFAEHANKVLSGSLAARK